MGVLFELELAKGRIFNYFLLRLKKITHGNNLKINGKLNFQGSGMNFVIGNNCTINSGWRFNPLDEHATNIVVFPNSTLQMGENVGLSNTTIVCTKRIIIGDNVLIGAGCKIIDSDFHSIQYKHRMESPDTHISSSPVEIMEGAFIGAYSTILKGVKIGRHSVIGAGSVVTKSIPDDEIWGGNPVKFIRKIERNEHI